MAPRIRPKGPPREHHQPGPTAEGLAIAATPRQYQPSPDDPGRCGCDACTLASFGADWIPPSLNRRPGDEVQTTAALPDQPPDVRVLWHLQSADGRDLHAIEVMHWRDGPDGRGLDTPAGQGGGVLYVASVSRPQPFAFWYRDVPDGVPSSSVDYMMHVVNALARPHMDHDLSRVVWRKSDAGLRLVIVGPGDMTPEEAEAERAAEIAMQGRDLERAHGREALRESLKAAYRRDRDLEVESRSQARRQAEAHRQARKRAEIAGRSLATNTAGAPADASAPYLAPSLHSKRTSTDRVFVNAAAWLGFTQPEIRSMLVVARPSRKDGSPDATELPDRRIREFIEPAKKQLEWLRVSVLGAAGRPKR
jgi:hypothetical protein